MKARPNLTKANLRKTGRDIQGQKIVQLLEKVVFVGN